MKEKGILQPYSGDMALYSTALSDECSSDFLTSTIHTDHDIVPRSRISNQRNLVRP
jgi:hypothetical protein